jgi:hypothetical protein
MPINNPDAYKENKSNDSTVRPEWPPLAPNPPQSMGAVPNIGGPDPAVIRPQHPALPANPSQSAGAVPNIGGQPRRPNVRGGTSGPTG